MAKLLLKQKIKINSEQAIDPVALGLCMLTYGNKRAAAIAQLYKIVSLCGILPHYCSQNRTQVPGDILCSNQNGKWTLRIDSEDSKTGYLMRS